MLLDAHYPRRPARARHLRVLAPLLALGGVVLVVAGIARALPDETRASAFRASVQCAQGTPSTSADCYSWTTSTVSKVSVGKDGATVWVADGSTSLEFNGVYAGIASLAPNEQVQLLVWRGTVQGIEVSDRVAYAEKSAPLAADEDWGIALFGIALLCFTAIQLAARLIRRLQRWPGARPALVASLAVVGTTATIAGLQVFAGDTRDTQNVGLWGLGATLVIPSACVLLARKIRRATA